ncbi:MAG: hypothetical protein ACW99A_14310 [Candidatus Kariarchaeaceae archaeon]
MNRDNHINQQNGLIDNIKKIITSIDSETIGVLKTNKGEILFELSDSTPIITKYYVELILSDSLKSISFNHEIENLEAYSKNICKNGSHKNDLGEKSIEIDKYISTETFFLITSLTKLEFIISNISSVYSELFPNPVIFGKITKGSELISQYENEIAIREVQIVSMSDIIKTHRIPNKWKMRHI